MERVSIRKLTKQKLETGALAKKRWYMPEVFVLQVVQETMADPAGGNDGGVAGVIS